MARGAAQLTQRGGHGRQAGEHALDPQRHEHLPEELRLLLHALHGHPHVRALRSLTRGLVPAAVSVKYYGSREGRRYYGLATGVPCARHSRVLA